MQPGVVLFDLDGTLTESGPGIMRSLAVAFDAIGAPQLDQATMLRFVGPPLLQSFREVAGLDEPTSLEALRAYRRYFVEHGMFENSVYPVSPTCCKHYAIPDADWRSRRRSR